MKKDIENIKHDIRILTENVLALKRIVKKIAENTCYREIKELNKKDLPEPYGGEVMDCAKHEHEPKHIIGECGGPDIDISETPNDYKNPEWPIQPREPHEWKNHIDYGVRGIWDTFTDKQKSVLAACANESADVEEWE